MFRGNMNYEKIIHSGKTVFNTEDLMLLFNTTHVQTVRNFLQRMKKKGIMKRIQNGTWVLENYNIYELANKLKKESYISCETVLKESGAIYQYYGDTITSVSNNTLQKTIDGKTYTYRKIRDTLLSNPSGIIYKDKHMKATPERALCDMLYLSPRWHCDDLTMIDRETAIGLSKLYNKRVILDIKKLSHDRQKNT